VDNVSKVKICSLHFTPGDYVEPNAKLRGGRMVLKQGAVPVPSIVVYNPPPSAVNVSYEVSSPMMEETPLSAISVIDIMECGEMNAATSTPEICKSVESDIMEVESKACNSNQQSIYIYIYIPSSLWRPLIGEKPSLKRPVSLERPYTDALLKTMCKLLVNIPTTI
jgi:hypothetical protein